MNADFSLEEINGRRPITLHIDGIVLCGYTGRDQEGVRRHIEELAREGVEPPPSVPAFYPKPAMSIAVERDLVVEGRETSGEVEFVRFPTSGALFVGLGSDHTDRELERLHVRKSKQICPALVSKSLWDYDDVKDHWDEIQIRSWCVQNGSRRPYQDSTLATILRPEDLLRRVRKEVTGDVAGLSIFSGTPPIMDGTFVYADRFEAEMADPVLGRKLELSYTIQTLHWFKN
jgi:hypothetical protein